MIILLLTVRTTTIGFYVIILGRVSNNSTTRRCSSLQSPMSRTVTTSISGNQAGCSNSSSHSGGFGCLGEHLLSFPSPPHTPHEDLHQTLQISQQSEDIFNYQHLSNIQQFSELPEQQMFSEHCLTTAQSPCPECQQFYSTNHESTCSDALPSFNSVISDLNLESSISTSASFQNSSSVVCSSSNHFCNFSTDNM